VLDIGTNGFIPCSAKALLVYIFLPPRSDKSTKPPKALLPPEGYDGAADWKPPNY